MHDDVHGEWVMLWAAAMYNVLAILGMGDMVCLACMQVHESCMVCMVCMEYGLYGMLGFNLCCGILLLLNMVDMDRWKTEVSNAEYIPCSNMQ